MTEEKTAKPEIPGYGINVDYFVDHYNIENPPVRETLRRYPTLCYLLGRVEQPKLILKEGSGMFGLRDPEDAGKWQGMFNHIMGASRQVFYLSDRFTKLTPVQRQQFVDLGYDLSSLSQVDPILLRDFMFISHAGRRSAEEFKLDGLRDEAHPGDDSGKNTIELLKKYNADPRFLELMQVENLADYIKTANITERFPNIIVNLLTYPDWTFGQKPNTLAERFTGLRESQREPKEILDVLQTCANNFEKALQTIISPTIFAEMTSAGPYDWEKEIRQAYYTS